MIYLPEMFKNAYDISSYSPLDILIISIIIAIIFVIIKIMDNRREMEGIALGKNLKTESAPIIIGEYSDSVTVLFDHAAECALVVCNRDPKTDGSSILWAHTKVLDVVDKYDKNHLFFINMANEDFYVRYLNNEYLKLNEKQSKILKGYPTNCDEIMNALFLINYNGISAGFEGAFLCKSE